MVFWFMPPENVPVYVCVCVCVCVCACAANNSKIIFSSFEGILFSDLIFNELHIYWISFVKI